MLPFRFALTSLTKNVLLEDLAQVAAALQAQVMRDFAPEWQVMASVSAALYEAIPADHIPIIVHDLDQDAGVDGFHSSRADGGPYALVPYGQHWSLAASNELLRFLADPSGCRRISAPSWLPGQGDAEYVLDVCAACQDIGSAYVIDGVIVSDFCCRAFFSARAEGPFSFSGAVSAPFRPAPGGVVTWLADDDLLYQMHLTCEGITRLRGGFPTGQEGLRFREVVDGLTPDRMRRLVRALAPQKLHAAQQTARRTRLTGFLRLQDELIWRMGKAAAGQQRPPEHKVATLDYAGARSLQNLARGEFNMTERTAS